MPNWIKILQLTVASMGLVIGSFAQSQPQSIKATGSRLDSLSLPNPSRLHFQPDTLYADELSRAEVAASSLTHKIDSLRSLNLPTDKYKRKLDSLSNSLRNKVVVPKALDSVKLKTQNSLGRVIQAQDSLSRQLEQRRSELQKLINHKTGFLDSLTNGLGISNIDRTLPDPINVLPKTQLPSTGIKLPDAGNISGDVKLPVKDMNLPDNPMSEIKTPNLNVNNPLSKVNEKVTDIQHKAKETLQNNKIGKEAGNIKGKVQEVNGAVQKAETYREEIKDIKDNGLSQADDLTKAAEEKATEQIMKQEAMSELKAQEKNILASKNMIEQYQDMLSSMYDKKEALATAKDLAAEHLDDPFAGQEENSRPV